MIDENTFKDINFKNEVDEEEINLLEIFERFLNHWKLFLICLILSSLLAFFYLRISKLVYEVSTTIFIDDKESGGLTSEMSAFEDLGIVNSSSRKSIVNESGVLRSRSLMARVVKDLKLNIAYYVPQKFVNIELYKSNKPIDVNFLINDTILYKLNTSFSISPISKSKFILKNIENDSIFKANFGDTLTMGFGEISIHRVPNYKNDQYEEIIVKVGSVRSIANRYRSKLTISPESKKSSLLVLTLRDNVKRKALDILNYLVIQYNKDAIDYKSLITQNTDRFINDRINDISYDLSSVDRGVEDFKTKNKLTDIDREASINLESNTEIEKKIIDLNSQIKLIDFVLEHMNNNKDDLIPANLGLNESSNNGNIISYNKLLLERKRIIKGSSDRNPTVINIDSQLATLKQVIEQSLLNLKSSLTFSLNEAKNQEFRLISKRDQAPQQEREFQDIKRKQQIIESLYLYLLQKREENAIALGIPVPNAKLIDKADGSSTPVSPNPKLIYLIAGFLGIFIPAGFISVISFLNNKVQTYEDLEKFISAPILGEIPKAKIKKKYFVEENDKSAIAEAFRLVRTNLHFMFPGKDDTGKTIFITSTLANEGKTFISINLASVLASVNKKVLVIGADLRKPKLSEYGINKNNIGLTELLINQQNSVSDAICFNEKLNFDIIYSGAIPPNPTNLLMNKRFGEIISFAKENYDYVIVDTPPFSLVADTLLISPYADLYIYVIRENFLDKRIFKKSDLLVKFKKLNNIAMIMNQTSNSSKSYGYGYGYGN